MRGFPRPLRGLGAAEHGVSWHDMQDADTAKYVTLMEEVKRRIVVVNALLVEKPVLPYLATAIESTYLQLRKILELIAFGSLVANREEYSKVYVEFAKSWNARLLLRDLERVNPDFYPRALVATPGLTPDVKFHFIDNAAALTKDEFLKLYEKAGAMLHAENPFGAKLDYEHYLDSARGWRDKILALLDTHMFHLVGSSTKYVVQMGGFGKPVHLVTTVPRESTASAS